MNDSNQPPSFLRDALERYTSVDPPSYRPHVTLTFAQSLDARIAGAEGRQLILSGKESMIMTHWMRTMHDAILIGIGTALNDDPQLNARHLPPPPPDTSASRHHLPRPIIIDRQLRLSPTCKLLQNFQNGMGRRPYILSSFDPESTSEDHPFLLRKRGLEAAGARIFPVHGNPKAGVGSDKYNASPGLSIASILQVLRDLGIRSLMVEGGAQIISSFFAESPIDTLILTIAPIFVGDAGVGYKYLGPVGMNTLQVADTQLVGKDTVVVMKRIH